MKEMGPGTWQDTLDDYFGDWNWRCITQLGQLTLRKLLEATKASMEHDRELRELEACIEMQMITEWQREISEWECDNSKCNPYEICVATITQASVQLELARAETSELEAGNDMSPHPEVLASTLISSGLEFEEQQRLLKIDTSSLGSHPTDNQLAKLQERANILKRRIDNWRSIQLLFMPCVAQLRDEDMQPGGVSCPTKLSEHEWKLCEAQAHEALRDLRHFLHLCTHLYKFKDTNVQGQVANTCAQTTINRTDHKVSTVAAKYHVARAALLILAPLLGKEGWEDTFRLLKDEDIHAMKDICEKESEDASEKENLHDALRIEWCKARARQLRWEEEKHLLQEEQRCILAFFDWQADWWMEQGTHRSFVDNTLEEGLQAYAARQSVLQWQLGVHFRGLWAAGAGRGIQSI
ncbi:hypothetical protein SCLCIDRAFT_29827 [Scleroderma citrinum Foug A]|uniref:Uncharacterized protein n=1 Tax=Scleroderma citrinum Foug A TaxID=1036808 RepID=A0A0C3DJG5_9AGAM|nr:hypothetical protein SCLCIDRAFT_29827 [Scleroderma citrinum Foug A]